MSDLLLPKFSSMLKPVNQYTYTGMDQDHISVIDSLIRLSNKPPHARYIAKQLTSYLNINFNEPTRVILKETIHERINIYYEEQSRIQELNKIAKSKKHRIMESLLQNKIRGRAWLDLLYTENISRDGNNSQRDTMKLIENDVEREHQVSGSDHFSALSTEQIYRNNRSLLLKLDHNLTPHSFGPDRETYKTNRRLRVKRMKSQRKYLTFGDSMEFVKSNVKSLHTWSESIQRITNISKPLSGDEVVYLVFRYLKECGLFKNSTFIPDEDTMFLSPDGETIPTNILFQNVYFNRGERVGGITRDGIRYLDSVDIEDSEYSDENVQNKEYGRETVQTLDYNITEEMIQERTTAMFSEMDIDKSFIYLFKSNALKVRKKKLLDIRVDESDN